MTADLLLDPAAVLAEPGLVLLLDARSAKAWSASAWRARGAVRIRPAALAIDPGWDRGRLTVVYCA